MLICGLLGCDWLRRRFARILTTSLYGRRSSSSLASSAAKRFSDISAQLGIPAAATSVRTTASWSVSLLTALRKSDLKALDFVVDRLFVKLFQTNNMKIIRLSLQMFNFAYSLLIKGKKILHIGQ